MPSIKQIEAFFWSGQLGSFMAAAERLNTTQSNVSKRIQELENALNVKLFDRSRRAIQITANGLELLELSDELLRCHMRIRQFSKSPLTVKGPFNFGCTEDVALSWLANYTTLIQKTFPALIPISTVHPSATLNTLLQERRIDLAIATTGQLDPELRMIPLAQAERAWVASPRLVPHDRELTLDEMSALPLIAHLRPDAKHPVLDLLKKNGVTPNIVSSCNSMSALARMVTEGFGYTYLHTDIFADDIRAGRLKPLKTKIELPTLQYVAAFRNDLISPVAKLVGELAVNACDFTTVSDAT